MTARKEAPTMTQAARRPLTAADLAALPTELPTGTVRYELREGVLQVMAPTGDEHGLVESAIVEFLRVRGQRQGHGQVRSGEVGIVLSRNPDTVVGADAAFLTKDQLPARRSREGYLETIPALVVEVKSKNDTNTEIVEKIADYLAAGVRVVWVADPEKQTWTIHRSGQPPLALGVGDTLTADEIIPGFAVPIAELFEDLD
jgi:Uma2 family endonuclease